MAQRLNTCLFNEARKYLAGGVNSPLRAFKSVGGPPVFIRSAKGSRLYSEDKRELIDYCLGFGALILGHSHPKVVGQIKKTIVKGTSFGAPTKAETELAKLIIEALPSIEKIRLTNSGTEAVMSAIRLACAFTKRKKIIKFTGLYHGHYDYLFTESAIVLPYNNIKKAEEAVKKYYKDIAAIIVEPVAGNMGVVLPRVEFLKALRKITDKYGIVLIFDEVITGFRLSYHGAQGLFNIKPDLTCLGKIIGGGLPCGAFGARDEIMKLIAPEGKVYQAGTFSGNPVTVNAGITTLKMLKENKPYEPLKINTEKLCQQIRLFADDYKLKVRVNYVASMFSLFFTNKDVTDYQTVNTQDGSAFKKFFHSLLKEGIYFSPSGLEANFLSTAHTNADLEKTLKAIDKAFRNLANS